MLPDESYALARVPAMREAETAPVPRRDAARPNSDFLLDNGFAIRSHTTLLTPWASTPWLAREEIGYGQREKGYPCRRLHVESFATARRTTPARALL